MSSEKFKELLRRVEITGKARYYASRRLSIHQSMSQWTLTALALGQIVISLTPALSLQINWTEKYLAFGSIFFSVLILAYTLLLGMGAYGPRAVKIHNCGLELGRLARELYPYACRADNNSPSVANSEPHGNYSTDNKNTSDTQTENNISTEELLRIYESGLGTESTFEENSAYKWYWSQYYNILDKHENHSKCDYLAARYEYYNINNATFNGERNRWERLYLSANNWVDQKTNYFVSKFYFSFQFLHYLIAIGLMWFWIICMIY